jgi:hypothetical protein
LWTLLVAIVIVRGATLPRWQGVVGIALAFGIGFGLAEPAGFELGGAINAMSYIVWAVWLMVLGITLLVRRPAGAAFEPSAALVQSAAV